VNPIHSCLKRLVCASVSVLCTRFVQWTTPPACSLYSYSKGCSGLEANAPHHSARNEARAGIESSSACSGSAGHRPLHTSPR
jgi:hypothetical protein